MLGVRPEYLEIGEQGDIETEIYGAMPTGMETTLKLRVGEFLLTGVMFGSSVYQLGQVQRLSFRGNRVLLFDRQSVRLVSTGALQFG